MKRRKTGKKKKEKRVTYTRDVRSGRAMPDTRTEPRRDNGSSVRSPRGPELSAKSWLTEAPLRMLMNNLDPEVAEKPEELVVYGGIGRAARDRKCFEAIEIGRAHV